jgi:hypothetical protein
MVNAAFAVARREGWQVTRRIFFASAVFPQFFRSPGGLSRRAAPPGQPGWFTEGFDPRDLKGEKGCSPSWRDKLAFVENDLIFPKMENRLDR